MRVAPGVGVELEKGRIQAGRQWLADDIESGNIVFSAKDIYDVDPVDSMLGGSFNLIILKDVIEHIHDQAKLVNRMKRFLAADGMIFLGFPPWQMPFGGHQQMCRNRILSNSRIITFFPHLLTVLS